MITAVDSSVLLDVIFDDPDYAQWSASALHQARTEGTLVICECVVAEVGPTLPRGVFPEFLNQWDIQFSPSTLQSSLLAAESFRRYLARGGRRGRVPADFLIGAHAQLHGDRFLARDRGFYRDYFRELNVWGPSQAHGRKTKR